MITGSVTPTREAVISLELRGPDGRTARVQATIDTGFDSFLMLPMRLVTELHLEYDADASAVLADGTRVELAYYWVELAWDGAAISAPALAADCTPLVGMSLLYGCDLRIAVIDGGEVTIAPLAG